MNVVFVTGRGPYNLHQQHYLQAKGVETTIYKDWGIHLPSELDEILKLNPQILHLQWPESICLPDPARETQILEEFEQAFQRIRRCGIRLCWTMHNLIPHDRRREAFWGRLYQVFADHCDVCCHHSHWGMATVRARYRFPNARHVLLRHGYFDMEVCPAPPRQQARTQLGLPAEANIYFSLGALRPDKNIPTLLDAFSRLDPETNRIVFAGRLNPNLQNADIKSRMEAMPQVMLLEGFVDKETVSLLASAADAFLFLHGNHHLTSGAPHLSQAYLLPHITLESPYVREVLGEEALYIPDGDNLCDPLHSLLKTLPRETLDEKRRHLKTQRIPWQWPLIAAETRDCYEEVLKP